MTLSLALLLAGHAVGDFVVQTDRMAAHKNRLGVLLSHVVCVLAAHTLLLAPILSSPALPLLLVIAVSHALIDRATFELSRRRPSTRAIAFALDQALHLAVLVVCAMRLAGSSAAGGFWTLPAELDPVLTLVGFSVAAYAFNWHGASTVVGLVLARFSDYPTTETVTPESKSPDRAEARRGRAIGILERMFVLTLVLLDQWGALGLALAFKSIARFKDLDDRRFSESYLIGTLTSVLVAMASALAVRLVAN